MTQNLIKTLKSGDLLYIKSIDRLGRNYGEIQEGTCWNFRFLFSFSADIL